jgi:hypothetical protein
MRQESSTRHGHDAKTSEGCHILMLGEAEGKIEQKAGCSKEKTRQQITNSPDSRRENTNTGKSDIQY